MTTIRKSDAQLDAEAEAQLDAEAEARKIAEGAEWTPDDYGSESGYRATPSAARHVVQPIMRKPRTRLETWRAAIAGEAPTRTTSHRPPETVDEAEGVRLRVIDAGTRTGVSMSGAFLQYIDTAFPTEPDGNRFPRDPTRPGHEALVAWDRFCRKHHARWPDHRGRPVCAEIAWYVLRDRTTLLFASEVTNVSYPRAENLLRLGVDWMARQQRRWIREAGVQARHEREGSEDCPVCRSEVAG